MFLGIVENMREAGNKISESVRTALGPIGRLNNPDASVFGGSDVRDILIQLIATILLFVVIRFFFWKPITKILESRRDAIDKALDDANKSKENARQIEAELQEELSKAKIQVKELLDKAERDGNLRREAIINDAKEEARRRLENLEVELEQEKKNMEKDIKKQIVDIAFLAAEKIVAKEINQDKYLDVVDDILKGAN